MSGELSASLDPRQVADLIAGHLADAHGRRRVRDQLLGPGRRPGRQSLGYYPTVEPDDDRAVLRRRELPGDPARPRATRSSVIVDVDDPAADPAEVALLPGDGQPRRWRCCRSSPRASRSASSS